MQLKKDTKGFILSRVNSLMIRFHCYSRNNTDIEEKIMGETMIRNRNKHYAYES